MRTLSLVPSMLIVLFTVLTGCAALQAGDAPDSSSTGQLHPPAPKPAIPAVMRNAFSWEVSQDTGNLGNIERLKALNPNVVHTWPSPPGIRGCRPPVLLREWVKKRWQAQLDELHAAGIRVWASTDSTGFSAKVFEECGLDPEQYYARDENGERVLMLGGGYGELYSSCYNNPEWFALQKEIAMAFGDAGFEGLWLDVGGLYDDAVFYCHCEHCRKDWRDHMVQLGMDPNTPLPERSHGRDRSTRLLQEHLRWRWKLTEDNWMAVKNYVRRKHPDFLLIPNMGYGVALQVPEALYFQSATTLYDVVSDEQFGHGCAPYTNVCSYLRARTAGGGKAVVSVQNDMPERNAVQHRIALAEGYACGAAHQNIMSFWDVAHQYYQFVEQHEELLKDVVPMASVGIVMSWWSKALYEWPSDGLAPSSWFGQMLVDLHVPFDYILAERDLKPEILGKYDALVLPDWACMSDEQIAIMKEYLENGGCVIATNNTGGYDENLAERSPSGRELLTGKAIEKTAKLDVGRGRFVYLNGSPERTYWQEQVETRNLANSKPLRPPSSPPKEVQDALDWAFYKGLPLRVKADSSTVVLPYQKADKIVIHFVNFNTYPDGKELTPAHSISVDVKVPAGRRVTNVTIFSPDLESPKVVAGWTVSDGQLNFVLDELQYWSIAVADLVAKS